MLSSQVRGGALRFGRALQAHGLRTPAVRAPVVVGIQRRPIVVQQQHGQRMSGVRTFASVSPDSTGKEVVAEGEIAEEEDAEEDATSAGQAGFTSKATRRLAVANMRNLKGSPRKMNEILRLIRGLSVDEALIQLKFCEKRKSVHVAHLIQNATHNGVNNFQMDRSRLVVAFATANQGRILKRPDFKARGKLGWHHKRYTHLKVVVKEQEYDPKETRVGRKGRTFSLIDRTMKRVKAYQEANGIEAEEEYVPEEEEE